MRGVSVLLLLNWPDPLLELDQASHVWGEVVLFAAWRRRLVAAVLLILIGHHLLDTYHGFGLTYQGHLADTIHTFRTEFHLRQNMCFPTVKYFHIYNYSFCCLEM